MNKRLLSLLLAVGMAATVFTACGGEVETDGDASDSAGTTSAESDSDASEETEWDEDPAEVTWMLWNVGGNANEDGIQQVEDALNEITLAKINVKVDLQILDMGTYMSQMPMQVSSGDKIDLITTFPAGSGSFSAMQSAGQLTPLKDLLEEYAPETLEVMPEVALKSTTVGDDIYGLPVLTDYTNDGYWVCRKSYLDEVGMTVDDIQSQEDITTAFEKMYAAHPELKMISSGAQNLTNSSGTQSNNIAYDSLGTDIVAVMVDKDPTKVVSYFETEEFKEEFKILQDWYKKGYVDKDIATRTQDPTADASVISGFSGGNMLRVKGSDGLAGEPRIHAKLTEGYVTTSAISIMNMAVPTSATEPEAAVKLMNLCYTDKDVKQLVSYGIEGVNYTYTPEEGLVVNADSNYAPNTVGIFGNVLLCDPTAESIEIGYDMSKVSLDSLKYSPLLGFRIDYSNISSEEAALQTVFNEYKGTIMTGVADDATYDEFIDKMYANGLQKYIDEVQKQLDEWYAAQE